MTRIQLLKKNKGLIKAFKKYNKRYLSVGKKPNVRKLLPDDLYHTLLLEGEMITRKETQTLFK